MYYSNRDNFKVNDVSDIQKIKRKTYMRTEPFVCPKCNRAWQHYPGYHGVPTNRDPILVDYLEGFPKTGCSKNICKGCKEKVKK